MVFQRLERTLGMGILVIQLGFWAVALAGVAKLDKRCNELGKTTDDCALDHSVPWTVYWINFVICIIGMLMIVINPLRHFKNALLSIYSIVVALLAVIAYLLVPFVYYRSAGDAPSQKAIDITVAGCIGLMILDLLWMIIFNGHSCFLNPAPKQSAESEQAKTYA